MLQSKEDLSKVQVKELRNGATECFSFELKKGELKKEHVEAYLKFLTRNKISEVLKALLSIYFTAMNDEYFRMDETERLHFENTLIFLTDHIDEKVTQFL